ncbi:MAG: ATP-binding protein, partial [Dehalococcoidia bacterium]
MAVKETLRSKLRSLRLSSMLRECERLQGDRATKGWAFEDYLEHLVSHEVQTRESRAIENRMKKALYPAIHRLEEYDFRRMPELDEKFIAELHNCEWIRRGDNVVYSGGHGLGKTHLAISNAVEACEKGFRVLFKKADQLVLELLEA